MFRSESSSKKLPLLCGTHHQPPEKERTDVRPKDLGWPSGDVSLPDEMTYSLANPNDPNPIICLALLASKNPAYIQCNVDL
jgi:hypothetical protein